VADVRHDFVKTINQPVMSLDLGEARRILAAQVDEGRGLLASEGVEVETVSVQHEADMQFAGQTHVLTVGIPKTDFEREDLMRAFEKAYWERFEVELREMRAQVVSLRTASHRPAAVRLRSRAPCRRRRGAGLPRRSVAGARGSTGPGTTRRYTAASSSGSAWR
jgi:N-methylhydantoinase A